jgi:hypothetical protein
MEGLGQSERGRVERLLLLKSSVVSLLGWMRVVIARAGLQGRHLSP